MDKRAFLNALVEASSLEQLEAALTPILTAGQGAIAFVPVGGRPNNRGAIEVASDPGRSLIERVTNAHDAVLELEHFAHSGTPDCRSPREAASAWLGVPEKEGLSGLTNKQRQDLAQRTVVRLEPGEGTQSRLISVIDLGIGIEPDRLSGTILSLNESNKIQKHYLAGTYGQGGSSTFAFSKYVVIVSRMRDSERVGFTIVKYEDLPADEYKTGRYVYLVENGQPLEVPASGDDLPHGTIVRHFGYDLTGYTSPLGPRSLYGVLGRILFDPVSSIRFENRVHGYNRTIKGARNALNGAVDEGDVETRGPTLDHHMPMFSVSLGDYGTLGIEYWVLARPESKDGKKRPKPADAFVDSSKPIVLSHNGQNQGELSGRFIKDDADLPYLQLQGRLICHINCDRLAPIAKRSLFSSTREQSREGFMLERIREELTRVLSSDDDLERLNDAAREQSLREKDEDAQKQMRRQVAKLLRLVGAALEDAGGKTGIGDDRSITPPRPRPKPVPIAPSEPPTYIKIRWDEDSDIRFYAGQRRYLRVETDANSDYHNPDDPSRSRINIAVGDVLLVFGTSPLKGGRMRIGVECTQDVTLGTSGSVRVELYRQGLSMLSDERGYVVVTPPQPKQQEQKSNLPDFDVIPVSGPEDDDWSYVCEEADDVDPKRHASNAVMSGGKLLVYYSEAYPRFSGELKRFEQQSEALSRSFRARYETWLAVHALIMHQETDAQDVAGADENATREMHRQERCRHASIAGMMASQEVKAGVATEEQDSS